jgi:hypothetical protein
VETHWFVAGIDAASAAAGSQLRQIPEKALIIPKKVAAGLIVGASATKNAEAVQTHTVVLNIGRFIIRIADGSPWTGDDLTSTLVIKSTGSGLEISIAGKAPASWYIDDAAHALV